MITLMHHPGGSKRLGEVLVENLFQPKWLVFRAAVAFVKQSGTKHLAEPLRNFLRRGDVKISVGIDHRGTSAEGLTELLDALGERGEAFVFHNRLRSTFHPKLYLFINDDAAECLIGSGNLTEGGLFTNYEAFFHLYLDKKAPDDCKFLALVETLLDEWSDATQRTVQRLTLDLIRDLQDGGDLPTEEEICDMEDRSQSELRSRAPKAEGKRLFGAVSVKPAPRVAARKKIGGSRPAPSAKDRRGLKPNVFVMTLQQTDVGVGQKTKGTSQRSPEVFIPMIAVRANPEFWGWPDMFEPDPKWSKKKDRDGRGKMDRPSVKMLLGPTVLDVHWWYNPDKIDIRLRNSSLRKAGKVGDIIRIDRADPGRGYEYALRIITPSDIDFAQHLEQCANQVKKPSKKRYGYF